MTIRHLKIFIEVVENNSMSEAGRKLFIAQPSVSQAIRELEKHYGTLLFQRFSKKLYITESGKLLYTYAKQVVTQFDLLEESMLTNEPREKVRLGATVSVGGSLLSPVVYQFRRKYPDTDVYAFVGNTQEVESRLLNLELDVGIVEGFIRSTDLITVPLLEDPLVLACSRNHPLAALDTLHISDLAQQDFVIRESGSGTRELLERFLASHHIGINVIFEAHTPDSIKNALRINQCLTLISARLIENELKSGEFKAFSSEDSQWNRYFRMVYHKNKSSLPYLDTLSKLVRLSGGKKPLSALIEGSFQKN